VFRPGGGCCSALLLIAKAGPPWVLHRVRSFRLAFQKVIPWVPPSPHASSCCLLAAAGCCLAAGCWQLRLQATGCFLVLRRSLVSLAVRPRAAMASSCWSVQQAELLVLLIELEVHREGIDLAARFEKDFLAMSANLAQESWAKSFGFADERSEDMLRVASRIAKLTQRLKVSSRLRALDTEGRLRALEDDRRLRARRIKLAAKACVFSQTVESLAIPGRDMLVLFILESNGTKDRDSFLSHLDIVFVSKPSVEVSSQLLNTYWQFLGSFDSKDCQKQKGRKHWHPRRQGVRIGHGGEQAWLTQSAGLPEPEADSSGDAE
jgi:hypothetical protein